MGSAKTCWQFVFCKQNSLQILFSHPLLISSSCIENWILCLKLMALDYVVIPKALIFCLYTSTGGNESNSSNQHLFWCLLPILLSILSHLSNYHIIKPYNLSLRISSVWNEKNSLTKVLLPIILLGIMVRLQKLQYFNFE